MVSASGVKVLVRRERRHILTPSRGWRTPFYVSVGGGSRSDGAVVMLSLSPPPPLGMHPPAVCHLVGLSGVQCYLQRGRRGRMGTGSEPLHGCRWMESERAAGGVDVRLGMREGKHRVRDFYTRPQKI
jgi:hypothetical protein